MWTITAAQLYEHKAKLDGHIFWRVLEGLGIYVKQSHPNPEIKKLLNSLNK